MAEPRLRGWVRLGAKYRCQPAFREEIAEAIERKGKPGETASQVVQRLVEEGLGLRES